MFNINKSYNFNTLAPTILGDSYKIMKVKAILTAREAVKYRDIQTLHIMLRPLINALPVSPESCTFVLFENTDKEETLLAMEYIDIYSIVEVTKMNISIEVIGTTSDDVSILRNILLEYGYTNIQIKPHTVNEQ